MKIIIENLSAITPLWISRVIAHFPFDTNMEYPEERLYEMRGTILSYLREFRLKQRNTERVLRNMSHIIEQDRLITVVTPKKGTLMLAVIFSKEDPKEGVCAVCGCSDYNACYHPDHGSCWWVDKRHLLCSHCACSGISKDPRTEHKVRG